MSKASNWKKRGQAQVTCPSGEVVTVRRVSLKNLPTCVSLPAPLLTRVVEVFELADAKGREETDQPTIEEMSAMPDIVDAMLAACLVEPRAVIGAATSDAEISVRDIPTEDRIFLFNAAQQNFPEVPVATEGGETTLDALGEFPATPRITNMLHDGTVNGGSVEQASGTVG